MLTREIITANAVLAKLTEEEINAIVTLSQNDENAVIGARIGEIYRQMDTTIAEATGVARNGDEKTYLYLARATKSLKEQADSVTGLNAKITELQTEETRLKKIIADGEGNAETAKQLDQARKDLTAVKKQYNDLKAEFDTAKDNHAKELFNVRIENVLSGATAGLKFKAELPKSVTDIIVTNAIAKIKGMNPEYIDDGKGGKVLAFKDETGAILRNPENQLNPYNATELIARELKTMGVLDEGRKQEGTGGKGKNGGNGGTLDISSARTRIEAGDIIAQQLMAQGLTRGSEEFDKAYIDAYRDNNVNSLPER